MMQADKRYDTQSQRLREAAWMLSGSQQVIREMTPGPSIFGV